MTTPFHAGGLFLLTWACTDPPPGGGSGSDGGADGLTIDDVDVAPTERVATVLRVQWTTSAPTVGWVEYGPDDRYGATSPAEVAPSTAHEALLVGMPAEAEVHLRIVAQAGAEASGGTITSEDIVATTDPLPSTVPALSVTGAGQQGFTVTTLMGMVWLPTVLDSAGRVVWYAVAGDTDDRVFRTRLSRDGRSVICAMPDIVDARVRRIALDGTQLEDIAVPNLSHDVTETDDGALAWIEVDSREVDGGQIVGDRIVERDASGIERTVWTTWDSLVPGDLDDGDWTHANVLEFDADAQTYHLSLRNLSTIYEIDRWSGEVLGSIGAAGAMPVAEGSTAFEQQHGFQVVGDRLVVFDNGGADALESRVREYTLDDDASLATEVWSYGQDEPLFVYALGGVHRYEDGDTLVSWATAGLLERVDPDGTPSWQVQAGLGVGIGFAEPADLSAVEWPVTQR